MITNEGIWRYICASLKLVRTWIGYAVSVVIATIASERWDLNGPLTAVLSSSLFYAWLTLITNLRLRQLEKEKANEKH